MDMIWLIDLELEMYVIDQDHIFFIAWNLNIWTKHLNITIFKFQWRHIDTRFIEQLEYAAIYKMAEFGKVIQITIAFRMVWRLFHNYATT